MTDLLLDPKTRGVPDVIHKVRAASSLPVSLPCPYLPPSYVFPQVVAIGSRSQEKARAFADDLGLGKDTKAYGDYDGVLADEVNS